MFPDILEATGSNASCELDDATALAAAIKELLPSLENAGKCGARGQRAAFGLLSAEVMAQKILQVLTDTAQRR